MMNDLENLLRTMPLRRPSDEMDRRVLARPKRVAWGLALAGGLAVAAAVVLVMPALLQPDRTSAPAPAKLAVGVQATAPAGEVLAPWRFEQRYSSIQYEGLRQSDDQPWRQYRQQDVRVIRVMDPQTGDLAQMVVPVERVVLVSAEPY
jgi:hypothetical protein